MKLFSIGKVYLKLLHNPKEDSLQVKKKTKKTYIEKTTCLEAKQNQNGLAVHKWTRGIWCHPLNNNGSSDFEVISKKKHLIRQWRIMEELRQRTTSKWAQLSSNQTTEKTVDCHRSKKKKKSIKPIPHN